MTNPELIGLAKNRFLDEEDQVAIASHHYRRAQDHLITNSGLQPAAKKILWDYNGYARKCDLLAYGHFDDSPEVHNKYKDLYDNYGSQMRARSPWRISRVFLRHSRWYSHGSHRHSTDTGCPPSIIEDIYLKDVQRFRNGGQDKRSFSYYYSGPDTVERHIIENPNTPLELIVKISASSPDHGNRNLAMKHMASRS